MNITWGHKITLAFIAFGAFILYMVFKMINSKVELVEEDYYAKEIKFQNQIEKYNNAVALGDSVVIVNQDDKQIRIQLNKTNPKNITLYFYYPASHLSDTVFHFSDKNIFIFDKNILDKGRSKIKLEWNDGSKGYYFEKELLIY